MLYRYAISAGLAFLLTWGLFLIMRALVAMGEPHLSDAVNSRVIDFVRFKQSSETRIKKRKLPQKGPKTPPPLAPQLKLAEDRGPNLGPAVAIAAPEVDHTVKLTTGPSLVAAPSDGEELPLVRVEPIYPQLAAQRGLEGWVQVAFTIGDTGQVVNPMVVASAPPGIFDRAALRAVRKWKYRPKIVDGQAVATPEIQVRLTFELNAGGRSL